MATAAGAGGLRPAGMRGPRTRAWGRMATVVPGCWRRRRAEELQVPGDAVSLCPPGLGVRNGMADAPDVSRGPLVRTPGAFQEEARPGSRRRPLGGVGVARAQGAWPRCCPAPSGPRLRRGAGAAAVSAAVSGGPELRRSR